MNRYTFKKSFDDIFTRTRLHYTLLLLKPKPNDFDTVSIEIDKGNFFSPELRRAFDLPKGDGTFRRISVSGTKTKVVQRILNDELSSAWRFSDRSYAFRKGKSPYKAIRRVCDILRRYSYVAKADIESFFDRIDHEILIDKLQRVVIDKKIVGLIAYYLAQGALFGNRWIDKVDGVYQGDILSPLLSNIYLNDFDYFLESNGVEFVRYSDDLIFFGPDREAVSKARKFASDYLSSLKLYFNPRKTYLSSIDEGFEYLGIYFIGNQIRIDSKRLKEKMDSLKDEAAKLSLQETVDKLNEKVKGFHNYYGKIINDKRQLEELEQVLEKLLVDSIIKERTSGVLKSKKEISTILNTLKTTYLPKNKKYFIDSLISRAYSTMKLETPLQTARKRVAKEKRSFLQNQIKSTEIVVSQTGVFVGFSQGKVKLKQKGKVVLEAPINRIERILVLNKYTTLSVYLINECAKRKIDIDFIEKAKPYALLTYMQQVMPALHLAQLRHYFSPSGFEIAKEIVHTKTRNQINLLKYFNRRRKDSEIYDRIGKMLHLHKNIKSASDKKELMGIEGAIAVHYWYSFGTIAKLDGFVRTHKDSREVVNQSLNYGYAILYHRVQTALLHEGFNLYYPVYHATQANKPTLVFDLVEEFRQPVVDREILAMLNRGQKLTQTNALLSNTTIKLIVQNIQERLATPAKSRFGKTPLYNIIKNQANHLKHAMLEEKNYKGFVNKY